MLRYRIIHTDMVCDGMCYDDALLTLQQLRAAYPDNEYDLEEYNYVPPEGKRLGRDPDLH